METALYILGPLLVLIGVIGTVVPALPGAPLVFAGLLLVAWADDFQRVGVWPLVSLGALMLLALGVDALSTAYGVKKSGASGWALAGAAFGLLAGLFFPPVGLLLGPFLGALAGEYWARRDWQQATRAGVGAGLGMIVGLALRVVFVFLMIGMFLIAWFWN